MSWSVLCDSVCWFSLFNIVYCKYWILMTKYGSRFKRNKLSEISAFASSFLIVPKTLSHCWLFLWTTLTCFKHIRHLVISPICALCYFLPSVAVVGSSVCSQLATSVVILSPLAKCDLTLLFVWSDVFLKRPHSPIGCRCQVTPHSVGFLEAGRSSRGSPERPVNVGQSRLSIF